MTRDNEAKLLLYKGKYFIHIIVFNKKVGHYKVIRKLQKHFIIDDTTTKAGWFINGREDYCSNNRLNWRLNIANNKDIR